jgi:hypothetical protein
VSVGAEIVAAADPALVPYGAAGGRAARFRDFSGDATRAFVLEAVYEGYLMHYATPRLFSGMDPDLRLLAGDALYALGLSRLAEAGDLDAVAELSDLISLSAQVHAEGRGHEGEALWDSTAAKLAHRVCRQR